MLPTQDIESLEVCPLVHWFCTCGFVCGKMRLGALALALIFFTAAAQPIERQPNPSRSPGSRRLMQEDIIYEEPAPLPEIADERGWEAAHATTEAPQLTQPSGRRLAGVEEMFTDAPATPQLPNEEGWSRGVGEFQP